MLSGDVAAAAVAVARRGARRRNTDAPEGRPFRTVVKMNAREAAFVGGLAAAQRISRQAVFMRAVFTGGTDAAAAYERLREELAGARRLLAGLSVNVNQLARQANAHALGEDVVPVTAGQLAAAAAAIERAVARVDAVTARATPAGPASSSAQPPIGAAGGAFE